MGYDLLPLELLELILDNLSLADLLNASLVCRQWGLAAEELILRKSSISAHVALTGKLDMLRGVTRKFANIQLRDLDAWDEIRPVLDVFVEMFQPRGIRISGTLADHLNRFYEVYHEWLEPVERVRISLDDRYVDYIGYDPAEYTLEFPNARYLYWYECLYGAGEKQVTINAPNLRDIVVDDSLDDTCLLKISDCSKVRNLKCTFYTKEFAEVFEGTFPNLVYLQLLIYNELDSIEFFRAMEKANLVKLALVVQYNAELISYLASNVSSLISECRQLKYLQYVSINDLNLLCAIDLSSIAQCLTGLEYLELSNLFIQTNNDPLKFAALRTIKLKFVDFATEKTAVHLEAPQLETLSILAMHLDRIHCINESPLRRLKVHLEDSVSLREALERHIVPFLQRFTKVEELIVVGRSLDDQNADDCFSPSVQLSVKTLCLKCVATNLDCFEYMSTWSGLKQLILDGCLIGVDDPNKVVKLPNVKCSIRDVRLSSTCRRNFPIVSEISPSPEVRHNVHNSEVFFSN